MTPISGLRPAKAAQHAAWYRSHGKPELADRLEAGLVAAGRCRRCGRSLSDPLSVARGIGPDCWAKVNRDAEPTTKGPIDAT